MTYGYFEYCISWINFFGDHRFKHPWNHHQFHNMILWNFVEIIIFIKLLIDDDFNKISQYHIVKLMMVSWMLEHMIAKKVNSTDAIFKITICHWSPLIVPIIIFCAKLRTLIYMFYVERQSSKTEKVYINIKKQKFE